MRRPNPARIWSSQGICMNRKPKLKERKESSHNVFIDIKRCKIAKIDMLYSNVVDNHD